MTDGTALNIAFAALEAIAWSKEAPEAPDRALALSEAAEEMETNPPSRPVDWLVARAALYDMNRSLKGDGPPKD